MLPHIGAKSNFNEHFIKTEKIDLKYGKLYSQLFYMLQKKRANITLPRIEVLDCPKY